MSNSSLAKIIVGPVIGKVTDTTARILIEIDVDAEVECELFGTKVVDKSQTSTKLKQKFRKGVPRPFTFTGLHPQTDYQIEFPGVQNAGDRKGSFRTLKSNLSKMTIISLSCNSLGEPEEPVVWNDLIERYASKPGSVDLVLHVGDQVYADAAFAKGVKIVKETRGKHSITSQEVVSALNEKKHEIAEGYRDFYRRTWNYTPTRTVLSKCPSLTIWDDHDIRDDWGSHTTDYDTTSDEYFVGLIARQCYWEYQRQLWDDVFDENGKQLKEIKTECHLHKFGNVGVLVVDARGCRSFYRDNERPFVSTAQWNEIKNSLSGQDGLFTNGCRSLIVAMSVALCCAGAKMSKVGAGVMKDKMGFGLYPAEQIEFIKILHQWKLAGEKTGGNREVLIIGGDLHIAIRSEIRHEGQVIFEQIITSPIRQHPPPSLGRVAFKSLMNMSEKLPDHYSFRHISFKASRNFGVITAETDDATGATIRTKFFYRSKKKQTDHPTYSEGVLTISNISGTQLAAKDTNHTSDPYVKLKLLHNITRKTKFISKTLNPKFPETFKIPVYFEHYKKIDEKTNPPILRVNLFDRDVGSKDDAMGMISVPLHDILKKGSTQQVIEVNNSTVVPQTKERVAGTLSLKITFKPFS